MFSLSTDLSVRYLVHDDPEKGTYVERLTKQIVTNPDEIKKMIEKGMRNRYNMRFTLVYIPRFSLAVFSSKKMYKVHMELYYIQ